jgi:hypothetical protein
MAGRGISIDILANVRDALRGAGDVERALSDIESTLDDMARSGDSSTDKMSRGFRDLSRDADTSADKIERSYKQAYRDTSRAADSAADDARRAQRRMGEQSEEVGQEIRQNLGEGIANAARGDFESLGDTIGDTLGGAVAGIGGIGTAAIAAAGAAGLGALVAAFTLANEARQALEDRANDLAQAYIEAGTNVLDTMTLVARTNEILSSQDGETKSNLQDLTKILGDRATAARALAGDQNALAAANTLLKSTDEEYRDLLLRQAQGYAELSRAEVDRIGELQLMRREIGELNEVTGMATRNFQDSQSALKGLIEDAGEATRQVDDLGNQLFTLPDGTQIVIDAHTQQASTNVEKFKGDVDTVPRQIVTRFDADTWAVDRAIQNLQGRTVNVRLRSNGSVILPGGRVASLE